MDTATLIGLVSLAVAVIGLLITIIEKWHVIAPRVRAGYRVSIEKLPTINLNLSRRQFIGAGIFAVAGGAIAYTFKFFDITFLTSSNRWSKYSGVSRFVVNRNNGIIHLEGLCDDHLPANQTTVNNSVSLRLHSYKQQQITKAVLEELPHELKEELLIDAISKSPTSTHLYKYLIKLWGRNKEYSKIHEFLSVSIKFLESKLGPFNSDKEKRKYSKAINELRVNINHAEYLASISTYS